MTDPGNAERRPRGRDGVPTASATSTTVLRTAGVDRRRRWSRELDELLGARRPFCWDVDQVAEVDYHAAHMDLGFFERERVGLAAA